MNPGDSLFVYTDGAREAMNAQKQLFGTERMLEALNENPDAAPDEVISRMTKRLAEYVGETEQFDDITMLSFRYRRRERRDEDTVS